MSMDFEQFKQAVCKKLGVDSANLPDGLALHDFPEQEADGEFFDQQFCLGHGKGVALSCFPERWHAGPQWSFQGQRYKTLDDIDTEVLRETVGVGATSTTS